MACYIRRIQRNGCGLSANVLQVAKGFDAQRQREEAEDVASPRPRSLLHVEDLLTALRSHPRKAIRCREALEHFRQMEAFTCAYRDDRYLSGNAAPTQASAVLSMQTGAPLAAHGLAGNLVKGQVSPVPTSLARSPLSQTGPSAPQRSPAAYSDPPQEQQRMYTHPVANSAASQYPTSHMQKQDAGAGVQ